MDELTRLAEKVLLNNHYPRVLEWLKQRDVSGQEEAENLYFMFGVMDAADLQFDVA